mgnify:FL=1
MYNCVKLKEKDNVATVTKALNAGEKAEYRFKGEDFEIEVKENIPLYHKIALEDIPKGSVIYKYGCKIGYALEDIKKGTHVHTENLDSKMI